MKGDMSSDIALQRAFLRRGDQESLQELLSSYGPKLYGYLLRVTGEEASARAAFGEVARRLAEGAYSGQPRLFAGWLFGLAVLAARGGKHARRAPEGASEAEQIVRGLPEELREAFILSHYAQLLPEEVALALHVPPEVAVSRIERAVAEVGAALKKS
jgi:DNA-directed RNA polymerase specialized sigma24 family protein